MRVISSSCSQFQHSIFKTGNKTKKVTTVVDKVSKGEIAAGEKKVWDKETIEVPEDLPTTTNTKAIQIRYTMTVPECGVRGL